jgi:hypothetical protein
VVSKERVTHDQENLDDVVRDNDTGVLCGRRQHSWTHSA